MRTALRGYRAEDKRIDPGVAQALVVNHFYNQIAGFSQPDAKVELHDLLNGLTFTGRANYFDFLPHVLKGFTREALSWRISDHYPLWVEFEL